MLKILFHQLRKKISLLKIRNKYEIKALSKNRNSPFLKYSLENYSIDTDLSMQKNLIKSYMLMQRE